jgi:hypothetical protein
MSEISSPAPKSPGIERNKSGCRTKFDGSAEKEIRLHFEGSSAFVGSASRFPMVSASPGGVRRHLNQLLGAQRLRPAGNPISLVRSFFTPRIAQAAKKGEHTAGTD